MRHGLAYLKRLLTEFTNNQKNDFCLHQVFLEVLWFPDSGSEFLRYIEFGCKIHFDNALVQQNNRDFIIKSK